MPSWDMTSTDILFQCQDRTLEPESQTGFSSTMWTLSEVLGYISLRCMRYQREVGLVVSHYGFQGDSFNGISTTPGQERVQLPQNTIDVLRVAFINFLPGSPYGTGVYGTGLYGGTTFTVRELPREDSWSLDNSMSGRSWEGSTGPTPTAYNETLPGVVSLFLANPSNDIGQLDILSVEITNAITATGVSLGIPDEVTPYIVYGALEDMLRRAGEPQDSMRADYCAGRWEEGIALGEALLSQPLMELNL